MQHASNQQDYLRTQASLHYRRQRCDSDLPVTNHNPTPDATDPLTSDSSLELDTIFELLANQRRRLTLYTLSDATNGVTTLHSLIEDVTALTAAINETAFTKDQYRAVARDLYHWHLPVLADVGLIDCDARHEVIRYLDAPTLETWIDLARGDELYQHQLSH